MLKNYKNDLKQLKYLSSFLKNFSKKLEEDTNPDKARLAKQIAYASKNINNAIYLAKDLPMRKIGL